VYDLRPPALDELGLVQALREQAAQYSAHGLQITVDAPDQLPALPAAVEVAAYRIALEALTNVARHAKAQRCVVRLLSNGELQLEISDDGQGMDGQMRAGVGLMSMRERASELNGTCLIEASALGGLMVKVSLPLSERSSF
jgi:signal transduction histidine kinase